MFMNRLMENNGNLIDLNSAGTDVTSQAALFSFKAVFNNTALNEILVYVFVF